MKKKERIKRYGEAAYLKLKEQGRAWNERNQEILKASHQEQCRKGGKYYEKENQRRAVGIPNEKRKIRGIHGAQWRPFKKIIAPKSQIHHEWIPGTANYKGVALVEADQHRHGIIDVIQIIKGEITLFTEEEIRGQMT